MNASHVLRGLVLGWLVASSMGGAALLADETAKPRQAFLETHCLDCHNAENKKGGLDLSVAFQGKEAAEIARWIRLHDRVAKGEMPPGKRKPGSAEKATFLRELAKDLTVAEKESRATVLRRLNRLEYEHTLHDLLGIETPLAELLPEDGKAHGFDTVGQALDLSAAQLERYLQAADRAFDAAVRKMPRPESKTTVYGFSEGRNAEHIGKHWHQLPGGAVVFFNSGGFPRISPSMFQTATEGRYRLKLRGFAYQSKEPVTFAIYATLPFRDGSTRLMGYFALPPGEAQTIVITATLLKGETVRLIPQGLSSPNLPKIGPAKYTGAGLAIESVEVTGPIARDDWPGKGHRLLFGSLPIDPPTGKGSRAQPGMVRSKMPERDAETLLRCFAKAVYRRPLRDDGLAPYLRLARAELAAGVPFEQAMRTAYKALLCSPEFLYRIEPAGKLDDHALATRLSYFLWRSMPDAELRALADKGELSKPAVLRAQTERLLKDPRSERFVSDFVALWLNLRELEATTPDEKLYPEYDTALLHAMRGETEGFFREILHRDRPVTDFLHSDWTILNERLARHYGITGVQGPELRKVTLKPESHRGGLLTQASILKVSANGTSTSPVTRGAWVLERLLGEPPAPPPPGIPGVEPDIRGATTIREQLDKHRNLASCASCHKTIDPPGFALEAFDVIGGWRERYRVVGTARNPADRIRPVPNRSVSLGPKVDASGETATGERFSGPDEYKRVLMKHPDRFAHALVEKLAVFATGRVMGFSDRPALKALVHENAKAGRGFRDLIHRLVQSELFGNK